jgi:hypothetical protein
MHTTTGNFHFPVLCFERFTGLETRLYIRNCQTLRALRHSQGALKVIKKRLGLLPEATACLDILLFFRI